MAKKRDNERRKARKEARRQRRLKRLDRVLDKAVELGLMSKATATKKRKEAAGMDLAAILKIIFAILKQFFGFDLPF